MASKEEAGPGPAESALVPVRTGIIQPEVTADEIVDWMKKFTELKQKLLDEHDTTTIQTKEGPKKIIRKSGWRKLALAFNINDRIIDEQREDRMDATGNPGGDYVWRIKVEAFHLKTGRSAVGNGAASTAEKRTKDGKLPGNIDHLTYAMALTRAKSRAISDILGSGEPSAEEFEGQEEKPTKPLTEVEQKAKQAAADMALWNQCPHCEIAYQTVPELELHVHRDHPTKNAYPSKKVPAPKGATPK